MQENQASRTAQAAALRRAAHQLLDQPLVFADPLALPMVGLADGAALRADPRHFETTALAPYLRAFLAARSRFAEDQLALGVQRGLRQYVILGAGLDTFAYRNPYPQGALRVFEVDHPATQAFKRARLEEAGIGLPLDLALAPVDFHEQTLDHGLRQAGWDPEIPSFFSWLGVTPYLTPQAVMDTLRFIATQPPGSEVVFDYAISPPLLNPVSRMALKAIAGRAQNGGEPWRAFFDPAALENDLRVMGYDVLLDLGSGEINGRYFPGRGDGLKVGTLFHLMAARV